MRTCQSQQIELSYLVDLNLSLEYLDFMSTTISILVRDYPPNIVSRREVLHFEIGETVKTPKGTGIIFGPHERGWYQTIQGHDTPVLWGNPDYERYPVKMESSEVLWFYRKELSIVA